MFCSDRACCLCTVTISVVKMKQYGEVVVECGETNTSISGQDCNSFGSIVRRASPEGDNAVTLLTLYHCHAFIHLKRDLAQ